MNDHTRASFTTYTIGFGLSVLLTTIAFWLVMGNVLTGNALYASLLGLAVIQLYVQLHFFIHLGHETKPRWNLLAFLFMVLVVLIIVIGSIWIMNSLNYNMMPEEMEAYMRAQIDKGF